MRLVLAIVMTIGFFAIVGVAILNEAIDNSLLNMLIGTLASGFMLVLSYYFGSSKSSQDKTELLTKKE